MPVRLPNARPAMLAGAWFIAVATSSPRAAEGPSWTDQSDMLAYFQAATLIHQQYLRGMSTREVVDGSLKQFVRTLDPYSAYLTPAEFDAHRRAANPDYSGVGLEVASDRDGRLFCRPYAGGPAERSGVREGDELIEADGRTLRGLDLSSVAGLVRGPAGSEVRLRVGRGREARTFAVRRERIESPAVEDPGWTGVAALRLRAFDGRTAAQIDAWLRRQPRRAPVTLDLRGNPGGDLYAAVDAARLFLPAGRTVVDMLGRTATNALTSAQDGPWPDVPLILLQDARTASAAEVFIAALVGNRRAVSLGQTTFGKALTQRVHELLDGSALILSDAELRGPQDLTWRDRGLDPQGSERVAPLVPDSALERARAAAGL